MDQDIREALTDIKTSVRDGFSSVNKRIDDLVTNREFTATVQRLDSQHETLRRDFTIHESETQKHYEQVRTDDQSVRAELLGELEKMKVAIRWSIGLLVPAAGVVAAIVFGVLTLVTNGA